MKLFMESNLFQRTAKCITGTYKKSLVFLSRSKLKKFDNYLKEEKYVDKVKNGKTVKYSLTQGTKFLTTHIKLDGDKLHSKNGEIESNINYSAIVTITFTDIVMHEKVYINPLGLMITDSLKRKRCCNRKEDPL